MAYAKLIKDCQWTETILNLLNDNIKNHQEEISKIRIVKEKLISEIARMTNHKIIIDKQNRWIIKESK